jgi:hypothetical protein
MRRRAGRSLYAPSGDFTVRSFGSVSQHRFERPDAMRQPAPAPEPASRPGGEMQARLNVNE